MASRPSDSSGASSCLAFVALVLTWTGTVALVVSLFGWIGFAVAAIAWGVLLYLLAVIL